THPNVRPTNMPKFATAAKPVAAPVPSTAVAVKDRNSDYLQRYLDATPSPAPGRIIGLSKDGKIVFRDDQTQVPDHIYAVLDEETLVGWIKFNEGEQPDRHMGLIAEGFVPPSRESLGDLDEAAWPEGINGGAEDPWKMQIAIVLQDTET